MNLYFDNASTSFPKPPDVAEAMCRFLTQEGGTYGRAAYDRVLRATRIVEGCRDAMAALLGVDDASKIAFTAGATTAVNVVLNGLFPERCSRDGQQPKKRVWVSPLEHNAVMRPLARLERLGRITVEVLPGREDGMVDLDRLAALDTERGALVVVNHQSNVNGVIQPLKEICAWSRSRGLRVMTDCSQSLPGASIEVDAWGVDYAIFTGHKGLLGPTGTGGFFARDPQRLEPLQPSGDVVGYGRSRVQTGEDANQRDTDLHRRQEAVRLVRQLQRPGCRFISPLGLGLQPCFPGRHHGDFRHGEHSVQQDETQYDNNLHIKVISF